ncbi:MAG TPA: hypothetical protein VIW01_08255 [Dehalococcoidia bacterium]
MSDRVGRVSFPGFLFVIGGVLLVTVWGCGDGDEGTEATASASPQTWSGGAPPTYEEPVLVVPGDYVSPAGNPEAVARGDQAVLEDKARGAFRGEVAGVSLVSGVSEYYGAARICGGGGADITGYVESSALTFGYLPPGTWAQSPQTVALCPDGSQTSIWQEFITRDADFSVGFYFGQRVLLNFEASEERVKATDIAGKKSVVIEPVTEEGYGPSTIAIPVDDGLLVVRGYGLPLDQIRLIAEGIGCDCLS